MHLRFDLVDLSLHFLTKYFINISLSASIKLHMNRLSTDCANGDHFLSSHIKLNERTVEAKEVFFKKKVQTNL